MPPTQPAARHRGARRRRSWVVGVWLVALTIGFGAVRTASSAFTATERVNAAVGSSTYYRCDAAMASFTPYIWYRMDETSSTTGTMADSSGSSRTGAYTSGGKTAGAARACSSRDTGTAMTFNGSSGYAASPRVSGAAPNTFTVMAWFRTTSTSGGKIIGYGNVQSGASSVYDRHLYLTNNGKVVFGVYPGVVKTVTSPLSYNDGTWHLAVATLSTAGMRLYVDGALVGSDTTVTTGESQSNGYWKIAFDNLDSWTDVPPSRYFGGTLDDVAVVLTALSAAQVSALYDAGQAA